MESGGWSFSHYYRGRHVECHFGSKRRQNSEAGRPGAVTCGGHHQLLSGSLKECPALMRQMNIAAEIKAHKETDGEKEAKTDACCPCQISVSACHVSIPLLSAPHFIHYSAFYWLKARGGGVSWYQREGEDITVCGVRHICVYVCVCSWEPGVQIEDSQYASGGEYPLRSLILTRSGSPDFTLQWGKMQGGFLPTAPNRLL